MTHSRAILVLALLVVCGTFVSTSVAATSTVVTTVQAEQMTLSSGASVVRSSTASGGKAVELTNSGANVTSSIALPAATTSIDVVAHGTKCQQGWPTMTSSVDGTAVMSAAAVNSSNWQSYDVAVSLGAGSHTLSISDSAAVSCRTLYVDEIIFYGPAPAAPAAPTVSFTATPTSVVAGSASTLTWTSAGATGCVASGAWTGNQATAGSTSTGALTATAVYDLRCTGAGGSASATATVTVTPASAGLCQSVAIPAYFYPNGGAGLWSTALAAEPGVGVMVANVDNGPGSAVDPDYTAAIAQARAAGVEVFGYVYTNYGAVSLSSLEASISSWSSWYGVTNIFVDEASTSSASLSYYEALTNYVHQQSPGSQTIINFGTIPAESEMNAGDIVITFEGDYSTYRSIRFPSWVTSFAPTRFYNIVYDVPNQSSMTTVLNEAASDNVGDIYSTSDTLPNPYDTLPSYLTSEASQAHENC